MKIQFTEAGIKEYVSSTYVELVFDEKKPVVWYQDIPEERLSKAVSSILKRHKGRPFENGHELRRYCIEWLDFRSKKYILSDIHLRKYYVKP